jgi:S-adenosylmethionine decarboxylase
MTDLEQQYHANQLWGLSTAINLHDCDPELIRSAEDIKKFVVQLCDLLGAKRFGECTVVYFGEKPKIAGYSMTQLIETSLVSGHFVNETNAIYLDIFSCKFYEPQVAADFAMEFFKSDDMTMSYTLRK